MGARLPTSVQRLRELLDLARAVQTPDDLDGVLQVVGSTVAELLDVRTVAINLYRRAYDDFRVTHVVGSTAAQNALLGTITRHRDWEPVLQERFRQGRTYHLVRGQFDWRLNELATYVPDAAPAKDEGAWDPEDLLVAVLEGAEGELLGILSVDEPRSGRRPTHDERALLDAVAAHAALGVEEAQRSARRRRDDAALARLLAQSSGLAALGDAEAVVRAACGAVADVLRFGRVTAWLADDELVLRPAAAAGRGVRASGPVLGAERREAVLAAVGRPDECPLLDAEQARALLPEIATPLPGSAGRGPHAWRGHALLVALRRPDGELAGLLVVQEPEDRLLPARETLAAIRTFANQAAGAIEGLRTLRALSASESRAAAVLRSAMDAVVILDEDGRILTLNPAGERLFGHAADSVRGRAVDEVLVPPPKRAAHARGFAAARHDPHAPILGRRIETALLHADGSELPVELSLARASVHDRVVFTAFVRDISDRLKAERELRAERDRAQRYLDVADTMLVVLDPAGRLKLLNRKGCDVLGHAQGDLLGDDWFARVVPEAERAETREVFARLLRGELEPTEPHENHVVGRDGELRLVAWRNTLLREEDGTVVGTLSSGQDITEQRRAEQRIAHLAYHDSLTGLANRAQLETRLEGAVERAQRLGTAVALLAVDLDDFKLVNDSFGHTVGDRLLQAVAHRLATVTRPGDLLARHGGDEFLLLLDGLGDDAATAAAAVAERIVGAFEAPFAVAEAELWIAASVGVSLMPHDAGGVTGLLSHADVALYQAKAGGRGRLALYSRAAEDPRARLSLGGRLRQALAREEFELHFQPLVALATHEVVGAEALLRWRTGDGAWIPPSTFIPFAEESGLIEPIGDWVIGRAAAQAARWRAQGHDVRVNFNLSARQLVRTDLVATITELLDAHRLPPRALTAEITETALMRDAERGRRALEALHALGVGLALDDFGAAYSSLARLRELPVDELKIDRAFLRGVPDDPAAAQIIRAVVQLAAGLGMTAVAEGIERPEQLPFLRAEGCALGQGFHLGRPVPADQLVLPASPASPRLAA
jgi:diguanylate cyclase (GGDEF)-like protein/PAS domain S-box-containing protein